MCAQTRIGFMGEGGRLELLFEIEKSFLYMQHGFWSRLVRLGEEECFF